MYESKLVCLESNTAYDHQLQPSANSGMCYSTASTAHCKTQRTYNIVFIASPFFQRLPRQRLPCSQRNDILAAKWPPRTSPLTQRWRWSPAALPSRPAVVAKRRPPQRQRVEWSQHPCVAGIAQRFGQRLQQRNAQGQRERGRRPAPAQKGWRQRRPSATRRRRRSSKFHCCSERCRGETSAQRGPASPVLSEVWQRWTTNCFLSPRSATRCFQSSLGLQRGSASSQRTFFLKNYIDFLSL